MFLAHALLTAWITWAVGASATPQQVNPSFAITEAEARVELTRAARAPVRLERPVVILGGFLDVGIGPRVFESRLRRYVRGKIIRITFADCLTLEQCRRRVVETLDAELGTAAADRTAPVDVVGQSLGGLIALHAALDDPRLGKRLDVRRLFTISSPLAGARLATRVPWDVLPIQRVTRPDNALARRLAAARIDFDVFSYTRLRDATVGSQFAALAGRGVYWVDTPRFESAHAGAFGDRRIFLDIVRRLRGEAPVASDPPAPLPAIR